MKRGSHISEDTVYELGDTAQKREYSASERRDAAYPPEDTQFVYEDTSHEKKRVNLFLRYKARHIILAAAIILLVAYYVFREVPGVADFATTQIAWPWYRLSGTAFGIFPFSIAEWLCALAVVGALVYMGFTIKKIVQKPHKLRRLYATLVTLLAGVLMAYALICWLWGITYYSYTYAELSGIETGAISVEELKEVTLYFAEAANAAAEDVDRNASGVYVCDIQRTFSAAPALYTDLPAEFDFLPGMEARPKPMVFSYLMSHMNFTGMFFPMTGEANLNVHAPDCYIPSAVVHELSHQRGVAREQDANFTAVLVCMESDDPDFVYSGALLAYTHLANSLRQASYEDWLEVYHHLNAEVLRDLRDNYEYWALFQTPAADISEAAYEEFLQNQGQVLGMRSYGACVDLLVAYYGETARDYAVARQEPFKT